MTKTSAINRIHDLLDDNSFVEVGAYITARSTDYNMQSQETPADGVVTGYGTINGALVYVYSQDASVMGGSIGEMHAKKIEKLYHMAMKMGAPIIGLVDCAGLRLQESMDALDGFGKLYVCQAMASGVIPQIQAVFGNCGGGMAVASEMADFTFMEQEAKMFVNAPLRTMLTIPVLSTRQKRQETYARLAPRKKFSPRLETLFPSFRLTTRMTCLTANVRMT